MEIKPIRNARDHNQALRAIERLWGQLKARGEEIASTYWSLWWMLMSVPTIRLIRLIRLKPYGSVWNNRV